MIFFAKTKKISLIISCMLCLSNFSYAEEATKNVEPKYIDATGTLSGIISIVAHEVKLKTEGLSSVEKHTYIKFKDELNKNLQTKSIKQNIYFKTANSELSDSAKTYLENIIYSVDGYKDLKIVVSGYSDSRGDASYNMKLSQQRADTVAKFLSSFGIKQEILSRGYGETFSSPETKNKEDYFYDRKVTITLTKN